MKTKQLRPRVFPPKMLYATLFATGLLITSNTVSAQVKIGTNPTTIEPNSNLEVEASTAGRKMKVDKTTGQVTIADGTQGAGKVFTSNADGGGSWQPAHPNNYFEAYNEAPQTIVSTSSETGTMGFTKLNLPTEEIDTGNNYNTSTQIYTVPSEGVYMIYARTTKGNTPANDPLSLALNLTVNESSHDILDALPTGTTDAAGAVHFGGTVIKRFSVNSRLTFSVRSVNGTPTAQFFQTRVRIIKLF